MLAIPSALGTDLIIARNNVPVDYMIASSYANSKNIPIMFINPDKISQQTKEMLRGYVERGKTNLVIIGGKEAVSISNENELESMGFEIKRLWDWSRYGTAARVGIELWKESDEAIIIKGNNRQNFLLAQKVSFEKNIPILLTKNESIPMETKTALKKMNVKKVYSFENLGLRGFDTEVLRVSDLDVSLNKKKERSYWLETGIILLVFIVLLGYVLRKKRFPESFLTSEEKMIVSILKDKGRIKQSWLPGLTGWSKPKISRLVTELERRGIIKKEKGKRTNMLKLDSKQK